MKFLHVFAGAGLLLASSAVAFQPSSPSLSQTKLDMSSTMNIDAVNTNLNAPRDVATMDQWATACGVQRSDGFQLTSQDGADVFAMTATDVPANSPVLFVPNTMILSANLAKQEFGKLEEAEKRILGTKTAAQDLPQFYLFLKVLREYELGAQSSWAPWLNSLPRAYSNGASMTKFCFDCLPPLAGWLAMRERIKFIQFFQALRYVPFLSQETRRDKMLARWAFSVVFTRGTPTPSPYGDDFRIAPMGDMFNHGAETEITGSYDDDGNFYAYANYDIPAGSPLRMSYADSTNPSHLLARYGFLDYNAPASFCKIMITNPSKELKNMGYDHSKMLFYRDGGISPEVWDVMLYQILESDPGTQQALYQAQMAGDTNTKQAIHEHYYPQTLQAIRNHVDKFLYDLDRLAQKSENRDWNEHPRLPLILSHNAFVKETFLNVQANLQ